MAQAQAGLAPAQPPSLAPAARADEAIIDTHALTKRYGNVVALDGVDVRIPRAAIGLLGANGSGKSTLIKLLLGLIHPSAGGASMLGMDVARDALRIRQRVGYMPESDCLPMDVTAADFVAHMAEMSGIPARAARQRANDVLYQVGVDEERYRLIRGFSTGMKQRVKLAQAIVHDPELVFLDEPTNGMDPQGREEMLELINRIHRQMGMSVVLSSHLLEDVERTCTWVVMVNNGRKIIDGNIEGLMRGGSDVIVRIDGDMPALAARLNAQGLPARIAGTDIIISVDSPTPDDRLFDAVRDAAVDMNVPLRALRPRERSLEDVYIETVNDANAALDGTSASTAETGVGANAA